MFLKGRKVTNNENPNYKINKINKEVSNNKKFSGLENIGSNLYALFNLSEKVTEKNEIIDKLHVSKDTDNSENQNNETEKCIKEILNKDIHVLILKKYQKIQLKRINIILILRL